jgi:hypothetical protein
VSKIFPVGHFQSRHCLQNRDFSIFSLFTTQFWKSGLFQQLPRDVPRKLSANVMRVNLNSPLESPLSFAGLTPRVDLVSANFLPKDCFCALRGGIASYVGTTIFR